MKNKKQVQADVFESTEVGVLKEFVADGMEALLEVFSRAKQPAFTFDGDVWTLEGVGYRDGVEHTVSGIGDTPFYAFQAFCDNLLGQ